MARLIALDSSPLSDLARAPGKSAADRIQAWVETLLLYKVRVLIPEIADYEVRRELHRVGAYQSIERLNNIRTAGVFIYLPLTTNAINLAATLWAEARRSGKPTASPEALDADVILAAQALLAAGPGDELIIATTNVGHLNR